LHKEFKQQRRRRLRAAQKAASLSANEIIENGNLRKEVEIIPNLEISNIFSN